MDPDRPAPCGGPPLVLPSTGPDPLPFATALAAVLGYARGRRPQWFRSPSHAEGRWVRVPAYGYARFDDQPPAGGPPGDRDVLLAEGLHGRLDRAGNAAVRAALDEVAGWAAAAAERAAGRAFWALPTEEFSVLAEPGTVGAALRELRQRCGGGADPRFVSAALHHRYPDVVPHLDPTTGRQLWPHAREGDSGPEAVIHRELRANAGAFAALEQAVADLLGRPLTRLRLHDVLLWLAGSLRLTHAVAQGQGSDEWRRYRSGLSGPGPGGSASSGSASSGSASGGPASGGPGLSREAATTGRGR